MREVVSVFQKGFSVGLRKNKSVSNSVECLAECYNMVPQKEGIIPREEVLSPLEVEDKWPFPILYIGAKYMLFFTSSALYQVASDWSLLELTREKWEDQPHIADFTDYIVWSTPSGTWYFAGQTVKRLEEWGGKTCCNYRGQLICGEAYLPKGPVRNEKGEVVEESMEIPSENTLAWGVIGDIKYSYALSQESGWMTMPYIGSILQILPMSEDFLVYHTNGVYKMSAVTTPIPTFGGFSFGDIGPLNRNCVAGDNQEHLMLGSNRRLYIAQPMRAMSEQGRGLVLLDYLEYFVEMRDPIVTFDRVRREWWIGDANNCYIFNGVGLARASVTPTRANRYMGSLLSSVHKHGPDDAIITLNTTSLNSRDMKTLMVVESDIRAESAWGQVFWRADYRNPLKPTKEKRLDPRGFFVPVVSGSELEVQFRTNNFRTTHLSKVWLRYKTTDKTSIRGIIYAGTPSEQ